MRVRQIALVAALLLATGAAASAQLPFTHHPSKDPYRNLFGRQEPPQKISLPVRSAARQAPQQPLVVCGMLIVPADPKKDPKMVRRPPADGVEHKLRLVTPPVCRPD